MPVIKIKARFTDKILFEGEYRSTKEAVVDAVSKKVNLSGANLSGANLYDANLSDANLSGANLYDANLSGANLYGANLYDANLSGANLYDANLSGANLSGANLYDANLSGANLYDANLSGANLYGEKISKAPICISGFQWRITITEHHIHIGCKLYRHAEWAKFGRAEITPMASGAYPWWMANKKWILSMAKDHAKAAKKAKAA